jgi:hypothetical protein
VDVTPLSELVNRVTADLSTDQAKLADDILAGVNEALGGAPLAQAATMGGTHQKRKSRTGVNR